MLSNVESYPTQTGSPGLHLHRPVHLGSRTYSVRALLEKHYLDLPLLVSSEPWMARRVSGRGSRCAQIAGHYLPQVKPAADGVLLNTLFSCQDARTLTTKILFARYPQERPIRSASLQAGEATAKAITPWRISANRKYNQLRILSKSIRREVMGLAFSRFDSNGVS